MKRWLTNFSPEVADDVLRAARQLNVQVEVIAAPMPSFAVPGLWSLRTDDGALDLIAFWEVVESYRLTRATGNARDAPPPAP